MLALFVSNWETRSAGHAFLRSGVCQMALVIFNIDTCACGKGKHGINDKKTREFDFTFACSRVTEGVIRWNPDY